MDNFLVDKICGGVYNEIVNIQNMTITKFSRACNDTVKSVAPVIGVDTL